MDTNATEIIDTRLQAQLQALADMLYASGRGADVPIIIAGETRLLLKQIIAFTPPKTQKQGEQAIARDLNSIFTASNRDFLIEKLGGTGSNIDKWFTNQEGEKVHAQFDVLDADGKGMAEYHQTKRGSRGRVLQSARKKPSYTEAWKEHYVVSYEALAEYMQKIWERVGMLKSGFLRAYYELGGKLPAWIERHAGKGFGGVINNLGVPRRPSITISNKAAGVGQLEHFVHSALRARANAVAAKIRALAKGYAMDIRGGALVKSHAERMTE